MSVKLGNTNISNILASSGAATGTTDYTDLTNKPSINGIPLVGNKSTSDLGITISTDDFYTKAETNNKINTEIASAIQPKADKTYVDNQLSLKTSNSDLNSALALKSDKSDTYTKTETNAEINSAISTKADIAYVNTSLDSKVSRDDVYDKDEIDTQISNIERSTNNKLANKADKSTTYTKTETNSAINTAVSDKATTAYVDACLATKANQSTTYTKTEVDNLISDMGPSGDTLPVGAIIPYSGQTTPENWLLCDGREVSRTIYSQLFNVIGTIYGAGDGSTSFNLPNLTDRVPVGISNDIALGQTLGEKTHKQTIDEMPSHKHNIYRSDGGSNYTLAWGSSSNDTGHLNTSGSNNSGKTQIISETGGGQPFNIMQPSIGQNYIIKAKQSAGVVATVVDILTSTSTVDALSANQGRILNDKVDSLLYVRKTTDQYMSSGSENVVEYDDVITNQGDCFSYSSGQVTILNSSVKSVTVTASIFSKNWVSFNGTLRIFKNNEIMACSFFNKTNQQVVASFSVQKDDVISIKASSPDKAITLSNSNNISFLSVKG